MNEVLIIGILIAVGFLTGIISGFLGIGGGVIFIPTLHIFLPLLGIEPDFIVYVTIATSLLAGSFTSISAFANHFKIKNVDIRKGLLMSAGSIAAVLIVPHFVVNWNPTILKCLICFILFLTAIKLFFDKDGDKQKKLLLKNIYLPILGISIGLVAAMTGLGGSVVAIPIFMVLYSLDIKKAIGTSTIVVALTMLSGAITYLFLKVHPIEADYQIGYINLFSGLILGIASIFGTHLGVKFIDKFSAKVVRQVFAVFLFLVTLRMFLASQ